VTVFSTSPTFQDVAAPHGSLADPGAAVLVVLASASPARRATLTAAGVRHAVLVSAVDEDAVTAEQGTTEAREVALVLARAKAQDVAVRLARGERPVPSGPDPAPIDHDASSSVGERALPDRDPRHPGGEPALPFLVLGCDSVLELDGEVHGKPRDADEARRRWRRMRGRSGTLHTGHWVVDLRRSVPVDRAPACGAVASTRVHFATLSDAEIDAYVATGEPLRVAGAFTLDGLGGAFVTGIEGDHHNVVGVSLPLMRDLFAEVGLSWPAVWG